MPSLTPLQKQQAQQRKTLERACTSVKSAWSFKLIKTWKDVYKHLGYADTYIETNFPLDKRNSTLTFPELKEYLDSIIKEMEDRFKLNNESSGVGGSAPTELPNREDNENLSIRDIVDRKTEEVNVTKEEKKHPSDVVLDATDAIFSEETDKYNAKNNYGLIASPNESPLLSFYWYQKKAISQALDKIVKEKKTGILILSGTGTGKTFMQDGIIRRLLDMEYHEGRTFSHIPYLIVTKSTIVEQQKRVLTSLFNINPVEDMEVMNIEQLRSKVGQMWVSEKVRIVEGEEESFWVWKNHTQPCVIFFDESQGAKNSSSTQSKIMCAYTELPKNNCLVSISATPFVTVAEAKCFAISTKRPLDHLGYPKGTVLCNETWPTYAKYMADPNGTGKGKPTDKSPAAIKRLMDDLEDYVVRVKGVKPQFNADNGVEYINFETPEKRAFYLAAWERFLAELAKLKKQELEGGVPDGNYQFTILLKFAMAAELCHADHFAKDMYECVQRGKAAVLGCKFKGTHIAVVDLLVNKYGVDRDLISMCWGGGQTQLTKKQKAKNKIKGMKDKLEAADINVDEMLQDLHLEDVEDRQLIELDPKLKLGKQDKIERQKNIDDFQSGKSLYFLFTYKAGGVGLSIPHTDENTTFKCRRKASGYVVEEDIPKVPTRERETFLSLTYNAIELVQGVGRVPRINSLSKTKQRAYAYLGTIEMDIGAILAQKLKCLTTVVMMHEDWQDVMTATSGERQEKVKAIIATTDKIAEEDNVMIETNEEGEDDE